MKPRDFSGRTNFPGTTGNTFDVILHRIVDLERIPGLLFGLLLIILAAIPTFPSWTETLILAGFFFLDWILLAFLPKTGKSFGPPKPVVLVLGLMRSVVALLPVTFSIPLQLIGTGLVIYGFWIEPHSIRLTHQKLDTPKLSQGTRLRVLHLGDLHIERITNRERQLNQMVKSAQPDLILFSGDFLNLSYLRDPQAWEAARTIIKEWSAPLGVFAVTGSPAVDLEEVIPTLLDRLPIQLLQAEKVALEHQGQVFDLAGLSCTHKPHVDQPRLSALMNGRVGRFTILLYHSPDLAPDAAKAGIDLQLSGHTHGGQVRLPVIGALFTGSLYGKQFEAGPSRIGNMILYITRGIGMEGAGAPRVRLLCPPEIILWEIAGIG